MGSGNFEWVDTTGLPGVDCPCGTARRAFVTDPGSVASVHIVEIQTDSKRHFHKRLTETYFVLDGDGEMELDDEVLPLRPGVAERIKPGCRHRAVGRMKILNMCVPVFDPDDEWFD